MVCVRGPRQSGVDSIDGSKRRFLTAEGDLLAGNVPLIGNS